VPRPGLEPWQQALQQTWPQAIVELPGLSKAALDALRAEVTPTLPGHHFLKTLDSERVDEAESQVGAGEHADALAMRLRRELVYDAYVPEAPFTVWHIKLAGEEIALRGRIAGFSDGLLTLARTFTPGGRFDTLHVPKLPGDCVCRRTYNRASDQPLGELYNINTPVELGPSSARYVDLEVDVVRFPDGAVHIVDQAVLAQQVQRGFVSRDLAGRGLRLAERVAEVLRAGVGVGREVLGLML
jgi:hypothetical protein